jgi:hypothetical protein
MKIEYADEIDIDTTLCRKNAERLVKLLEPFVEFKHLVDEINSQMIPIYVYKVKCFGCGKKIEVGDRKQLSKKDLKRIEQFKLCQSCYDSEDFK